MAADVIGQLGLWFRVRAVAFSYWEATELPPNSNRGQIVDRFIAFVGLDPKGAYPWCAAAVYYCGFWGLYDPTSRKSAWPLKKTAGVQDLADFAKAKGVLKDEPEVGDVFVVWYEELKRFGHTGFLISKNADGTWNTLEGNTSKPGDTNPLTMREGWGYFMRQRTLHPADKCIRWLALV